MSLIPNFFGRQPNATVFHPFSMEIWDQLERWPNRPLSDRFRSGISTETASFAHALVDWKETPKAHVIKADVPGFKKEEVKVEVEDGRVLRISGQRSKEAEEKGDSWHRVERSSGKFSRIFHLPENAKLENVKATMENGVLTVTVPKVEKKDKKANVKSVEISG